jgi:hypothetical protein
MDNLEKYYRYNTRADFSCGVNGRGTEKDIRVRTKLGMLIIVGLRLDSLLICRHEFA